MAMLTDYIRAGMERARYEILDDGSYYGEISELPGVYSNAASLEETRRELQEVLEGWIVLGLRLGHTLPTIDGIDLSITNEAA